MNDSHPTAPLAGVRILDLTRILSGPYCTLLLAELGADVIKVERSDRGDDTRSWGPPFLDDDSRLSTYFAAFNRGKRSFAMDFRAPGARDLLLELSSRVDVVIENFRPGVAESFGLEWSHLSARNPSLVLCSISGFGHNGPYADLPATEIVVEALSGLMEITGPPDGDPVRFGIAMVDIATGLTAATKIVSHLMVARETGLGARLESSLYGTALGALAAPVAAYTATGEEPQRWGPHHASIVPYGGFRTADGYLITGIVNDGKWRAFCEALELDGLAQDERYLTNANRVNRREELHTTIAKQCASQSTAHWMGRLRVRGLLAAPVRTVGEAVNDPASAELGLLVPLAGHPGVYATRLNGEGSPATAEKVPLLGEHTRDVLQELLGMTEREIVELVAAGVVTTPVEALPPSNMGLEA